MKTYCYIFFLALCMSSCTKEIVLDLNNASPQLVIEGNISDEPGPYTVRLSQTVDFYDSNIFPPVSGAVVIISDNTGVTDTLTETEGGTYQTHTIKGIQGNTYWLKLMIEGKQYEAMITMPYKVNLDSIQFNKADEPGEDKTAFAIVPLYLDPIEFGNSYRFFFYANGVADHTYQVSNDNIGNGNLNQQPFFSDDVKFYEGDTVTVTMLCIDVVTYDYYYTLSQISGSGPGGGATPTNPPNNITGDNALGIFTAYTTQTISGIAK